MKIKYLPFYIAALTLSSHGFAQSNQALPESTKTSSSPRLDLQEVKHGPLADFYELVAQYQLPKKELAKSNQAQTEVLLPSSRELIADTKNPTAPKP